MGNSKVSARALAKSLHLDGFANLLTGVGVLGKDSRLGMAVSPAATLSKDDLNNLYRGDGFAHRIVEQMVFDSTREGFCIEGDEDRLIMSRFEDLSVMKVLASWLRWGRLFGGSILVMGIDDGASTLDIPLNEERNRNFLFLKVYDRFQVTFTDADRYTDTLNPKFGEVEFYTVKPVQGAEFRVHETRCIVYDGAPCSDLQRKTNLGWGDSEIQACYERIRALTNVYDHAELIVKDYTQGVIQIGNLIELLSMGKEDIIKKRLSLMDLSRNVLNSMLIDKSESYSKVSSSVAGIPEIINCFAEALSGASSMPISLLLGKQGAGMGAEDTASTRGWYDAVGAYQEERLLPAIERLVAVATKSAEIGATALVDWKIEFTPLWQPSAKEIADTRKVEADTVAVYIQNDILTPQEVAMSMFGGEDYSTEMEMAAGERPSGNINTGETGTEPAPAPGAPAPTKPEPTPAVKPAEVEA